MVCWTSHLQGRTGWRCEDWDSLDCSDHEMVEARILRESSRANSRITTLDFWREDCNPFRDLLGKIPWERAMQRREVRESWLIFKDHLLQAQECSMPTSRNKQRGQEACVDEQGAPD